MKNTATAGNYRYQQFLKLCRQGKAWKFNDQLRRPNPTGGHDLIVGRSIKIMDASNVKALAAFAKQYGDYFSMNPTNASGYSDHFRGLMRVRFYHAPYPSTTTKTRTPRRVAA